MSLGQTAVRQAVGALVYRQIPFGFLQVHKVLRMDGMAGIQPVAGMWDFPKGGVKPSDESLTAALMRELLEETGSTPYELLYTYPQPVCFDFSPQDAAALGFTSQHTHMFLCRYTGNGSDLTPQDGEIDSVRFVSRVEMYASLAHVESRHFFTCACAEPPLNDFFQPTEKPT